MKVITKKEIDVVTDVRCDICEKSTSDHGRYSPQFGTLHAQWGYGANHDGETYEVHLCESCFFQALANIKEQRRGQQMFSEQGHEFEPDFGRVINHNRERI